MFKLSLPSKWSTIVGLVLGALQVVNGVVLFHISLAASAVVGAVIALASNQVGPIIGPAFRAALQLPPWLNALIGWTFAGATAALVYVNDYTTHWVVASILTVAAGLGFGSGLPRVMQQARRRIGQQAVVDTRAAAVGAAPQSVRPRPAEPIIQNVGDVFTLIYQIARLIWHAPSILAYLWRILTEPESQQG